MSFNFMRLAANVGWALSGLPYHAAFRRALCRPDRAQLRLLGKLLRNNESCAFGKRHRFAAIKSVRDYQDAVPVSSYEDLESWIERIATGGQDMLCSEPVLAFEKTSGSTGSEKLIPYTATLLREFQRAIGAWMWDLYANVPGLASGSSYWCITPLNREAEVTRGGVRVGLQNDLEYFSRWSRGWLRRMLAVPPSVATEGNLDQCLYATGAFLRQARDLAFISVWNPSFLTLLLDFMERQGGGFDPEVLWPNLRLISCWTDGAAKLALRPMREKLPNVSVQGKGLLATEGVISIPLVGHPGHCLAIASHFLEFEAAPGERPQLAHELTCGEEYTVIMTTGGGLWRYRLGDRIRVVGHVNRTPLIEFIGREGGVSDLRGEKLNPLFVAKILAEWKTTVSWDGTFAMVAPVNGLTPFYALFVDGSFRGKTATETLDELICANSHYAYCRRLGQLGHARIFFIRDDAGACYLRRCMSLGQRAGSVKPTSLHRDFGWEQVFSGQWHHDDQFRHNQSSVAV